MAATIGDWTIEEIESHEAYFSKLQDEWFKEEGVPPELPAPKFVSVEIPHQTVFFELPPPPVPVQWRVESRFVNPELGAEWHDTRWGPFRTEIDAKNQARRLKRSYPGKRYRAVAVGWSWLDGGKRERIFELV